MKRLEWASSKWIEVRGPWVTYRKEQDWITLKERREHCYTWEVTFKAQNKGRKMEWGVLSFTFLR